MPYWHARRKRVKRVVAGFYDFRNLGFVDKKHTRHTLLFLPLLTMPSCRLCYNRGDNIPGLATKNPPKKNNQKKKKKKKKKQA